MACDPNPKYFDQFLTPKDQIGDFLHHINVLQKHNIIFNPLALETDLAWMRVKDYCADFPRAFSFYFSSWEHLAYESAVEHNKNYPGLLDHFIDCMNSGRWTLTLYAEWDSIWNLGKHGYQHTDDKITRTLRFAVK